MPAAARAKHQFREIYRDHKLSERFHNHKYDYYDHQYRGHLVHQPPVTGRAPVLVATEGFCAAAEIDMGHSQRDNQRDLGMQPAATETVNGPGKVKPNTQVIIIAGFMIKRMSRCSMTLKVSDCTEPTAHPCGR